MPGTTSLHLCTISCTLQNVQVKGIFPVFIGGLSEASQHDEGENQSDDVHVSPLLSGGVFVLVVGRIGVLLYMIKILKAARFVYLFLDFSRRKYQKQKRLSQLRKSLFAVKGYDSLILSQTVLNFRRHCEQWQALYTLHYVWKRPRTIRRHWISYRGTRTHHCPPDRGLSYRLDDIA